MLGNGAGRGCLGKGWVAKPGRGVDCTVEGCVGGSPQPVGNQRKRCPRYLISSSMTLPPSRYTLQPPLSSGEVTGRGAADERAPSTGQDIGRYHPPSTRRHGLYYSGPFCRQIRKLGLSEAKLSAQSHMAHASESKPQAICLQSPHRGLMRSCCSHLTLTPRVEGERNPCSGRGGRTCGVGRREG